MSKYASAKWALGICDRSGFTYKLKDLLPEVQDGKDTGLRVHRSMLDPDQPQLWLGRVNKDDPQAIRNARPDQNLTAGRDVIWNWAPVGDRNSLSSLYGFSTQSSTEGTGEVGSVTVVIS